MASGKRQYALLKERYALKGSRYAPKDITHSPPGLCVEGTITKSLEPALWGLLGEPRRAPSRVACWLTEPPGE